MSWLVETFNHNKTMRKTVNTLIIGLGVVMFALPVGAQKEMAMTHFVLKGKSAGGELVLTHIPELYGTHPNFVVTNFPGDDSGTVLERLARAIVASGYVPGEVEAVKKGDSLILPNGGIWRRDDKSIEPPMWIVGGNDRGFKIPPAPLFLSATYQSNQVILRWINEVAYDSLWVFGGVAMAMALEALPGDTERYVCDIRRLVPLDWPWPHGTNILLAVVGVKDGVPSTATAIRLVNFVRQEPVIDVPFSHGVVPGFRFWAHLPTGAKAECYQRILHPTPIGGGTEIWRLKYCQVFKGTGTGQMGLYRRWLGLQPGHAYRVSAHLNKLDTKAANLQVTLCAVQLPRRGEDLTPKQMAGEEALPDGKSGKNAGQLARCDVTASPNNQQTEVPSGMKPLEPVAGEIMLSGDHDSIAVWCRVEIEDGQEVALRLESLAIEDLGKR